jgi:hypothetical protein
MGGVGGEAQRVLIRVTIDLADGSRLIGVPRLKSIPIRTSYAWLDVPLDQIVRITVNKGPELAAFTLRNGDELTGVISLSPLRLETSLGRVSIRREDIRRISICRVGNTHLPDALRNSLTLHYSFDDGDCGGIKDMMGENDGTAHGVKWAYAAERGGGTLEFREKGDNVKSPMNVNVEGSQPRTVAAWIRCDDIPADGIAVPVGFGEANRFANPYLSGTLFSLAVRHTAYGKVVFGMWGINAGDVWSATPLTTGRWYHVAAAFDGKEVNLYVDGRLDISKAVVLDTRASLLFLGRIWGDYPDRVPFQGAIDEVMIFSRALLSGEVKVLFQSGS